MRRRHERLPNQHHAGPHSQAHAERWLRPRGSKEFDIEDIGALAVPAPDPEKLSEAVRIGFSFLSDLNGDEAKVSESNPKDRALVLRMLAELPDGRLAGIGLY